MKLPTRVSFLFFLGIFIAGSSASLLLLLLLRAALKAAAKFMEDMEKHNEQASRRM
jgi:hypothetical protein